MRCSFLIFSLRRTAPLSTYDFTNRLCRRRARMVANQVYRALACLIDRHRVLRIETFNADVLRR